MDKAKEAAIRAHKAAEAQKRHEQAIKRNHAESHYAHRVWSQTGKTGARLPFGKRK